jgi:hypothetical protein
MQHPDLRLCPSLNSMYRGRAHVASVCRRHPGGNRQAARPAC